MLSELMETMAAFCQSDEVALADGLADLLYVVVGTMIAFDIPMEATFAEVHKSNMTKSTVKSDVNNHTGSRGKGKNFQEPAIAACIKIARRTRGEQAKLFEQEFEIDFERKETDGSV